MVRGKLAVAAALLTALVLAAAPARGGEDAYPNKPIRLILGVAPGGSMETAARQWQPYLQKELGVPIVIDCIPGADGMIGNKMAAESAPDGYTFVQMPLSFLPAQTLIFKAPYKFEAFEIISTYINDPMVIFVNKDSPWKTIDDLIDHIKKSPPSTVTFGQSSLTAPATLALHAMEEALDIKLNIVPFAGGGPSRLALAGGHTDASLTGLFAAQHIEEYVRVLAVAQAENLWPEDTDNAPTINDALKIDIPHVADTISIFAPAGFAQQYPERFKIFTEAFFRALSSPEYKENLIKTGQAGRVRLSSTEDSQAMLDSDNELYKRYLYLFKDYGKK